MQTIHKKNKQDKKHQKYNNKLVVVDHTLNLISKSPIQQIRGCSHSNPWPRLGFKFLEHSVISTQLWLHRIRYYSINDTRHEIEFNYQSQHINKINNQILIVFDQETKLNIIFNIEINCKNTNYFNIKNVEVIDYITYLKPLVLITHHHIIATIIARATSNSQHLFDSEIVSISSFRPFYIDQQHIWRYYKEIHEIYRNNNFKFIQSFDISKSINYGVRKRIILSLNEFVYLEIILVKEKYFENIFQYYSGHNELLINTTGTPDYTIHQPHQIDHFNTLDIINTKFYPQEQ